MPAPGAPRWRGGVGRLEVHYLTATDLATGTGLWLHHEVVAPTEGDAYAHGWLAVFPTGGSPTCTRFGPEPARPLPDGASWFRAGSVEMTDCSAQGSVGSVSWDLSWQDADPPLWTFPAWAWRRQLLPAAQMLPTSRARLTGRVGDMSFAGPVGVAHIYGHGNAQRWVWLHADLGDGDVLEVVAATARRPGLRALPPLPLVQLRLDGADWPGDSLAAAALFRAKLRDHGFSIRGVVGARRLRVDVSLPEPRCVVLGYTDPDGATATCTNSERADAQIHLDRLTATGWKPDRAWILDGIAHAEIGTRP